MLSLQTLIILRFTLLSLIGQYLMGLRDGKSHVNFKIGGNIWIRIFVEWSIVPDRYKT